MPEEVTAKQHHSNNKTKLNNCINFLQIQVVIYCFFNLFDNNTIILICILNCFRYAVPSVVQSTYAPTIKSTTDLRGVQTFPVQTAFASTMPTVAPAIKVTD